MSTAACIWLQIYLSTIAISGGKIDAEVKQYKHFQSIGNS